MKIERQGRPECGTKAGYIWHTVVLKEPACTPCNNARNASRRKDVKVCLTEKCTTRVYHKTALHCSHCRKRPIVGWVKHEGTLIPVYPVRGEIRWPEVNAAK